MAQKTEEEAWAALREMGYSEEDVAAAKAAGKDPADLITKEMRGEDSKAERAPRQVTPKSDYDTARDARHEEDAMQYLHSQMTPGEIAEAMAGGKSARDVASEMVGDVAGGPGFGVEEQPGSGEDILAERPFEHGGDKAQTYDAEGKTGDPPGRPPGLPPGYRENLELIDWLKGQAPGAEDLQYEAPTYGEESLRLPEYSEAGQARPDFQARAAQYGTLGRMEQELGNRGVGPEDILALTRISKQGEDARLSGEQKRQRELQARGMVAGGAQLAGGLAQGNRIREGVGQARGDVLSQYTKRGQQAAQQLGDYGGLMGRQTFGEGFSRGEAKDRLSRENAEALVRRQEDVRGLSNTAERQRARSGLMASANRQAPVSAYLGMGAAEGATRGREQVLDARIEAENKRRASSGPGFGDWLLGGGALVAGALTGSPSLLAGGTTKMLGNIEGATNKQPVVKKKAKYNYG